MTLARSFGMMTVGAAAVLAGTQLVSLVRGSEAGSIANAQSVGPNNPPLSTPAPATQVSRSQSDIGSTAGIGELADFVAQSLRPVRADMPMTAEQDEVFTIFKRAARDLHSVAHGCDGEYVRFNEIEINGTEIQQFYTVRQDRDELADFIVMDTETQLVNAVMCDDPIMRSLIDNHGFEFTYTYSSQDGHLIGDVKGDTRTCDI